MSKQSEAKEKQGYIAKPVARVCANCAYYRSDVVEHPPYYSWSKPYHEEKNRRCDIGGFAVNKTATCNHWLLAQDAESLKQREAA